MSNNSYNNLKYITVAFLVLCFAVLICFSIQLSCWKARVDKGLASAPKHPYNECMKGILEGLDTKNSKDNVKFANDICYKLIER